ncbi:hypothetical protein BJQ96_03108 [Flavobacterium sp. PL0002]|uniref:Uncharacterized protein n=1 Tax=Flavobacterium faecale TaxID=1355330 RepID=A0A2S1LGG7_9FLAO|nr:hypothetical protein FFWV33_15475 [Flavobacterium faecale]MBE0393245.1 hypothetical protein [Flavobacterium sp. PL002]
MMKLTTYFSLMLVIFNLISLYFIIDLLSYDEIVGYWFNGRKKSASIQTMGYLLFVVTLLNLYFIFLIVVEKSNKND